MIDVNDLNWNMIYSSLNEFGFAKIPTLMSSQESAEMIAAYGDQTLYRNIINMERYRFGKGEYKYFAYPLPLHINTVRKNVYEKLVPIANDWMHQLNIDKAFPASHEHFIEQCHDKDQQRPTPLILRYEQGGYNTLHQDLYGEIFFPFQLVCLLTQPGKEHEGGEFVITEQIPRAQSKARVIHMNAGDAMIFTTNFRPIKGTRGYYRASMKHGISEVTAGVRYSLGIIFHDAS